MFWLFTGKSLGEKQRGQEWTEVYQADRFQFPANSGELYPYWNASVVWRSRGVTWPSSGTSPVEADLYVGMCDVVIDMIIVCLHVCVLEMSTLLLVTSILLSNFLFKAGSISDNFWLWDSWRFSHYWRGKTKKELMKYDYDAIHFRLCHFFMREKYAYQAGMVHSK